MFERYFHQMVTTSNGTYVMVDVTRTPDAGIESAYSCFDKEAFEEWWGSCGDGEEYTEEDVREWGEEADAFLGWTVVQSHCRNIEAAVKRVLKVASEL